jgi:hypothetical protein
MAQRFTVGQRLAIIAGALLVGAVFVAGLFVHGRLGGALLLLTVAILVTLTRATWAHVRPQGRPLRVAVIVAIAVFAVVKLVHG